MLKGSSAVKRERMMMINHCTKLNPFIFYFLGAKVEGFKDKVLTILFRLLGLICL